MSALTAPALILAMARKGILRTKRMFRSGCPLASALALIASSLRATKRASPLRARAISDRGSLARS